MFMKNNSNIIVVIVIIVAIATGVVWYQYKKNSEPTGQVYVSMMDATTTIENVSGIDFAVQKVELHNQTNGWITVSSADKTYDLLELHARSRAELYGKNRVPAGIYDRVRMTMGDVTVKTLANGNVQAYTPGAELVVNIHSAVKKNTDTEIKIDVLADQSIHKTQDEEYIFTPVVKTQSISNANVSVANDSAVTARNGTIDGTVTTGMDLDGTSRTNFQVDAQSDIQLGAANVTGNATFMLNGKLYSNDGQPKESADAFTEKEDLLTINGALNINDIATENTKAFLDTNLSYH
jgi:hypothetical protein